MTKEYINLLISKIRLGSEVNWANLYDTDIVLLTDRPIEFIENSDYVYTGYNTGIKLIRDEGLSRSGDYNTVVRYQFPDDSLSHYFTNFSAMYTKELLKALESKLND